MSIDTLIGARVSDITDLLRRLHRIPEPASEALKDESSSVSGGSDNRRLVSGLVVAQIALSLTLLVISGLFLQTLRNPAWIVDSIERLVKRNAFELSGIFSFDRLGTVYSRADGLSKSDGMLGFAYAALREAVYGPYAERLLLVRYETLTANPLAAAVAAYRANG